jgi:putative RNA 2'-phosphotransferase
MASDVRRSKMLSRWLRHRPAEAGLALDPQGWADVEAVLAAMKRAGAGVDRDGLAALVATNDKQRFELSEDGTQIRARQGHSQAVDLKWPECTPPMHLYHGTVERFLPTIFAAGLQPMGRHHVHLSPEPETARRVGQRRGPPVVLIVQAEAMARAGGVFMRTSNDVWLTKEVPPQYLEQMVT